MVPVQAVSSVFAEMEVISIASENVITIEVPTIVPAPFAGDVLSTTGGVSSL